MGFLSSLSGAAGAVLGSSGGSAIAGALGLDSDPAKVDYEKQWKYTKKGINLGNQWDIDNQKEMFDYRISQGIDAGMTPFEMFSGPAAGAGGGTTGSGQTLGNAGNQAALTNAQLKQQADQKNRDRYTALAQTAMQTSAQKDVAEIQAGATTRGQDIQALIAGNRLALDERQLNEIAIPQLALATDLNEQQVKAAINEVANTDPAWVRKKTVMQLGVDNGIQNLILGKLNLDLTNPKQIQSLSDEQYADALEALLSAASGLGKTSAAAESIFERIFGSIKKADENFQYSKALERGRSMLGRPNPHDSSEVSRVLGQTGPVPAGTSKYKNFSRDFPGR